MRFLRSSERQFPAAGFPFLILFLAALACAQTSIAQVTKQLPPAPLPQAALRPPLLSQGLPGQRPPTALGQMAAVGSPSQNPSSMPSSAPSPAANSGATALSLKDAEALAIKNNPQISVARLTALASQQVTREVRSNLWPTVTGNITGVDAEAGSRITAGALNNPIIYERAAGGVMVSQLITDFGRTYNLISSANYAAKAQNENAIATKEQILLAVNQAFFNALQAQAVLTVAQQTVKARQTVADQVGTLYKNKLKSRAGLQLCERQPGAGTTAFAGCAK